MRKYIIISIITCCFLIISCHSKEEMDECYKSLAIDEIWYLSNHLVLYAALHPDKFGTFRYESGTEEIYNFIEKTIPDSPYHTLGDNGVINYASQIDSNFKENKESFDVNWRMTHGYYSDVPKFCANFSDNIHKRDYSNNLFSPQWSIDPWGSKYKIEINLHKSEIIINSAGPDMIFGTNDDLKSSDISSIDGKLVTKTYIVSDIVERSKKYIPLFEKAKQQIEREKIARKERIEKEAAIKRERERERRYKTSPRGQCESGCNDVFTQDSDSWRFCMMGCEDMRSD